MKWLGRVIRLFFGLLWRLVMLLLFERWVPFPQTTPGEPSPPAPRAKRKKQRPRAEQAGAASRPRQATRKKQSGRPIFSAASSELSPEEAARREGEHWLKARRPRAPEPPRPAREHLAGLVRDRRALRDAVVLGAALGRRARR